MRKSEKARMEKIESELIEIRAGLQKNNRDSDNINDTLKLINDGTVGDGIKHNGYLLTTVSPSLRIRIDEIISRMDGIEEDVEKIVDFLGAEFHHEEAKFYVRKKDESEV